MIIFEYKERIIKFILCSIILIITMLIFVKVLYQKEDVLYYNDVLTSNITYNDDTTSIYVEYPRFNENDDINSIVSNNIYDYIKNFKSKDGKKELNIKYNLYYIDNYVNIEYNIENSLDSIKNNNILIDLENNKLAYITSIFDEEYLSSEIYKTVKENYSEEIYNQVIKDTINNFTYIFNKNNLYVTFNNIKDNPFIYINFDLNLDSNDNHIQGDKYIAFTYDDGPSEYTSEIIDILEKYNSSATFFMLGNKMKSNDEIVLKVYNSNSEIGSHGYSHKNINDISISELESEINTTNIIFNEITKDNIKYYRPSYGEYSDALFNLGLKVINWNIDPKDWLVKDTNRIYNNVIKNACDGCIVVLHDTYETTVDATKKMIPALNKLGYKVVSISELMNIKNNYGEDNKAISFIK